MTSYRVRFERESAFDGAFEWHSVGAGGIAEDAGVAPARQPPPGSICDLVIASDLVLLEQINVPEAQRRRLSSRLGYLTEESVISEPERVHVVGESRPSRDATLSVGIIDREWLERALARLSKLQLVVRRAYPECLLAPLAPMSWTVISRRTGSFARVGPTEGFSLDDTDTEAPPVSLRLALANARESGKAPSKLVLRSAPHSDIPDAKRWAAQLGIAVEPGAEWCWSDNLPAPALDLLQGDFAPRTGVRQPPQFLRRTAILAGSLAMLATVGITLDWTAKAHERRKLIAEMNRVYRETFGEAAVVADAPLQMSRALTYLRKQAGQFTAEDFVPLLASVGENLLPAGRQRVERILYEHGMLTISLRPKDPAQFAKRLDAWRGERQAASIKIDTTESAGLFTLRASIVRGAER